jgi:hypothetical protein
VVVDARGNREYEAQEVAGLFLLEGRLAIRPYPKKTGITGTGLPGDE